MGRVWSVDAVAKNASTSFYGNIVSLAESPVKEGLLYVGTDDGLVQVTEDGGEDLAEDREVPGRAREQPTSSRLEPSPHDADTVYAAFDNHKMGDFKPYLLKSTDRGRTWTSIAGDLPARGTRLRGRRGPGEAGPALRGHRVRRVLHASTAARSGCSSKGGLPTIAVRDIAIQKRENDLVVATFGRGFYVLDDYTPLRRVTPGVARRRRRALFPVRQAWMFMPVDAVRPGAGRASWASRSTPRRQPAVRRGLHLLPEGRAEDEAEGAAGAGEEDGEEGRRRRLPGVGRAARRGPRGGAGRRPDRDRRGGQRRAAADRPGWRRLPPRRLGPALPAGGPGQPASRSHRTTTCSRRRPSGRWWRPAPTRCRWRSAWTARSTPVGEPQTFQAVPLGTAIAPGPDKTGLPGSSSRRPRGCSARCSARRSLPRTCAASSTLIKKAVDDTPTADPKLMAEVRALETACATSRSRSTATPWSGATTSRRRRRSSSACRASWPGTGRRRPRPPTRTGSPTTRRPRCSRRCSSSFAALVEVDMKALNDRLEAIGAPWTPGRVPRWTAEK